MDCNRSDTMNRVLSFQEQPHGRVHRVELPCVLGRGKESDLSLPDATVSHRHALISLREGRIWIEDLHSTNGVFVNGIRILDRTPVTVGDTITLGTTSLRYIEEEAQPVDETIILHALRQDQEPGLDRDRLKLIHEITAQLSENQDIQALQENLSVRLKEIFHHDRGCLALFQEDGSLQPLLSQTNMDTIPLSRSIIDRVFRNRESLMLSDAMGDASLQEQESVIALKIRSALCAPLIYRGRIYGLVYLDRNVPGAYNEKDLELLKTIAFILAPLVENARLWSQLKEHYDQAMATLRATEAKLIQREREAAYMRLAQAMAHEIRNPLMGIGGLVRRMLQKEGGSPWEEKLRTILGLAERVEQVMRDVDAFVRFPEPELHLERIDEAIGQCLQECAHHWQEKGIHPVLEIRTTQLLVPLDRQLFTHAFSLLLKEMLPGIPEESPCTLTLQDHGREIAVLAGEAAMEKCTGQLYDQELKRRPWSLSLFLNIAHKIISDHGGRMFFDPEGNSPYPFLMTLRRTIPMALPEKVLNPAPSPGGE